jgi:hypothetical protein
MPQPPPWQQDAPHESLAGHAGSFLLPVCAAGGLKFFVKSDAPHAGQLGVSPPRTRYSNSWPQPRQAYSYIGIFNTRKIIGTNHYDVTEDTEKISSFKLK